MKLASLSSRTGVAPASQRALGLGGWRWGWAGEAEASTLHRRLGSNMPVCCTLGTSEKQMGPACIGSVGTLLSPFLRSYKDLIPILKLPHPSSLVVRAPRMACVWRGSSVPYWLPAGRECTESKSPLRETVVSSGKPSVRWSLQTPWVDCGLCWRHGRNSIWCFFFRVRITDGVW